MAMSGYTPISNKGINGSVLKTGYYDFIISHIAASDEEVRNYLQNDSAAVEAVIAELEGRASALEMMLATPAGVSTHVVNGVLNRVDYFGTGIYRIPQVICNIIANYNVTGVGNDDSDNPQSAFNQLMHPHGNASEGLTPFGMVMATVYGLSSAAAFYFQYRHIQRKLKKSSFNYVAKKIRKMDAEYQEIDVAKEAQALLQAKADKEAEYIKQHPVNAKTDSESDVEQSGIFTDFLSGVNLSFNKLWGAISNATFVFWLIWLLITGIMASSVLSPIVLALSLAVGIFLPLWELGVKLGLSNRAAVAVSAVVSIAALAALIAVPMVVPVVAPMLMIGAVGVALVIGAVALGLKIKDYITDRNQQAADPEKAKQQQQKNKNIADAEHAFKQQVNAGKLRVFLQKEHYMQMKKLKVDQLNPEQKRKRIQSLADLTINGSGFDIEGYLLGSIHARRTRLALTGIFSLLGNAVMAAFIGWFGSAVLGAMGAAVAASWVGGSGVGAIAGGVLGSLLGIRAVLNLRAEQQQYEQKVRAILDAPYMRVKDRDKNLGVVTNEEAFKRFHNELTRLKAKLQGSAAFIKAKYGYDLNDIDPFNDNLFESYEHKLSGWDRLNKIVFHGHKIGYNAETGIFIARFAALTSGVLATAIMGLWPFFIVAVVVAVVYAGLSYYNYRLKREHEHKEVFANTLPERISYMKKKIKELDVVRSLLNSNTAIVDGLVEGGRREDCRQSSAPKDSFAPNGGSSSSASVSLEAQDTSSSDTSESFESDVVASDEVVPEKTVTQSITLDLSSQVKVSQYGKFGVSANKMMERPALPVEPVINEHSSAIIASPAA